MYPVFIGGDTDGAAVTIGEANGLKIINSSITVGILVREVMHIVWNLLAKVLLPIPYCHNQ